MNLPAKVGAVQLLLDTAIHSAIVRMHTGAIATVGDIMARKKATRRVPYHKITFEYDLGNGETHVQVHQVKVKLATKVVILELKAEDVLASLRAGGIANSLKCSMAMCCR